MEYGVDLRYIGIKQPPFATMSAGNLDLYSFTLYNGNGPQSGGRPYELSLFGIRMVRRNEISR
jgi:hypothetical protein